DRPLGLERHGVAAVRIGADGHGFRFECAQTRALAVTHVGIESLLMFVSSCVVGAPLVGVERGTRLLDRDAVYPRIHACEFLLDQRIGLALFDCGYALVVLLLVGLEDAQNLLIGERLGRDASLLFR